MSRAPRVAPGVAGVCAVLIALGALSRAPYGDADGGASVIRLSWRVRGVRVEECRRLTGGELDALPPHMRRPEVCEGRIAPYRLRVRLDGEVAEDRLVHGAGAREDRPLYVFRELRVPPGRHRIAVEFHRLAGGAARAGRSETADRARQVYDGDRRDGGDGAGDAGRAGDAGDAGDAGNVRRPPRGAPPPARLELDTAVILGPGEVALITYAPERRALVVRGAATAAAGRGG